MPRHFKRPRIKRRKTSIKATNAGPILALTGTILGILSLIFVLVFVVLPYLFPIIGLDYTFPWQPTPIPEPSAKPIPTPHPITRVDPVEIQHEIVLTGYDEYRWFADPYVHGNQLVFTAGKLVESDIRMDALFKWDLDTGDYERIDVKLKNHSFYSPVFNDSWLVYLDGKPGGGGIIRAVETKTGEISEVKEVFVGQPKFSIDGNLLAWIERTGSRMDKLFVCDLNTLETTVVRMFSNSFYGQSLASISKGQLIYADMDPNATEAELDAHMTSAIYKVTVSSGTTSVFSPGTFVHDPLTNGKHWVWRNGLHGEGDNLYFSQQEAQPKMIAESIVDYGLSDTFVAYSKDESIYVYLFDGGITARITPEAERERTQLLGVSGGVVVWMDVTSRERDIMKYAKVD